VQQIKFEGGVIPAVNFVSHQWTGTDHADPDGHFISRQCKNAFAGLFLASQFSNRRRTKQHIVKVSLPTHMARQQAHSSRRPTRGRLVPPLSKIALQTAGFGWTGSYVSRNSSLPVRLPPQMVFAAPHLRLRIRPLPCPPRVLQQSIPQVSGTTTEEETNAAIQEQSLAISSIPAYIGLTTNFWVCAPSGVVHRGNGCECNFKSWNSRGWTRMEEICLYLAFMNEARPLYVTHPIGEPPEVTSVDVQDRFLTKGRQSSVLAGTFTCCNIKHCITMPDGTLARIPCDKNSLRVVLHTLYDQRIRGLRDMFIKDPEHQARAHDLWSATMHSMKGNRAFFDFCLLANFRPYILAETAEEIELDAQPEPSHEEFVNHLEYMGLRWPESPAEGTMKSALLCVAGFVGNSCVTSSSTVTVPHTAQAIRLE
jgi:hypothetical protein